VQCLADLQAAFAALAPAGRAEVLERLGPEAGVLAAPPVKVAPPQGKGVRNRLWT
jgi:hypothetical protein